MSLEDMLNAGNDSPVNDPQPDKAVLKKNNTSGNPKSPAWNEKKYAEYKQTVASYDNHTREEKKLSVQVSDAKELRNRYKNAWKTASDNALALFKKQAGEQQNEADEKRRKYREKAQSIKNERLAELNGRKSVKENELKGIAAEEQSAKDEEKKALSKLKQLEGHTAALVPCDQQIQSFIKDADRRGWLTKTQKNLSLIHPGEFLKFCGGTLTGLADKESLMVKSAFMKNAQEVEATGKGYWRFALICAAVAFPVLLLIMAVSIGTHSGIGVVCSFLAFAGMAGIFCLVVSLILLKAVQIGIKPIILEVLTFILMALFGYLITVWCGGNERASANLFNMVIMPLFGSAAVFTLLNLALVRKLMSKLPIARKIMYKHFFASIEKLDAKKGVKVFQKGEADKVVVCYLKHDEYLSFFGDAEKAKLTQAAQAQLQKIREKISAIEKRRAAAENEIKALDPLYREAAEKDKETDRKLEEKLKSVDAQYGASDLPDFNSRSNLLPQDTAGLEKLEAAMSVKPGSAANISEAKNASNGYVHTYTDRLDALKEAMRKEIQNIADYYASPELVGLSNSDGSYNYKLESYICLLNALDNSRMSVIEHGYQPVSFVFADKSSDNNEENEVLLIRELWQAFAKIAPPSLFSFSIVDDANYLRLPLGYPRSEISSFDKYYTARYEPGILPEDIYPVCGLYAQNDSKRLSDEIFKKIDRIQEYSKKNSITNADIVNVNRSMTASNLHNAEPWNIVVYIVPGSEYNGFSDSSDFLSNMLKSYRSNSQRGGFIPIIISASSDIAKKWQPVTEQARKIGLTYELDLSDLTIRAVNMT